jgi:hypothetical protein
MVESTEALSSSRFDGSREEKPKSLYLKRSILRKVGEKNHRAS